MHTQQSNSRTVYLQLVGKKRNIGTISADGLTYTKSIVPSLHIHRKSNSIGFNYDLLKRSSFHWVIVNAEGFETLVTSRKYILEHGFFLHFKNEGFEKQIFLKISDFGIDTARQYEHSVNNQPSLFAEAV